MTIVSLSTGNILATGVERVEDLKEYGIKSILAQSLFKHIIKWKASGVPADIFMQKGSAANAGTDNVKEAEVAVETQVTELPTSHTTEDLSARDAFERQREALVAEWQARCNRLERERDAAQRLASLRLSCIDRKHNWPPLALGQRHSRCEGCNTWGYQHNGVWCEGY